ncbi:MAG: DUF4349 domain-containing protein [Fulvivirga sp.]
MKPYHFIIIALFFSCDNKSNYNIESESGDIAYADFEEMMEVPLTEHAPPPPPPNQVSDEVITKKVVKTGGVEFESKDIDKDYQSIKTLLPRFKGYIENESQNKTSHRITYNLTIRVPADGYDSLYENVSRIGFRLDSRYSNIDDVTSQYYDLKSRIKNKKVLEERYLELLKKASAIKDILEIERNLNEIRVEIESLEGQFKYLSQRVSLSTIDIKFYENLPYTYDATSRKGFGARILSALDSGWQGFLSFLVGVTAIWPFILLAALSFFLLKKGRQWIRKKQ